MLDWGIKSLSDDIQVYHQEAHIVVEKMKGNLKAKANKYIIVIF